jgi:ADP-heptose:LPS heptosyltransferase
LQQDVTKEEAEFLIHNKVRRPHLQTFMDTFRILETCEQVICIDSVIAHLAGSMGIPTSVLVSYTPDWRWLLDRSDSLWYPNIRLFRQTLCDSWDEPIKEVKVQRLDFEN